jgi:GNAT superfamily N-acetyltransferase
MEIARLRRGDGGRLRDARLRALADAPYAFSSPLEREVGLSPDFWETRVVESELGEKGAVFLAIEDDHSVGMAGGFILDEGSRVAMLWGMWVDPLARQRGLGRRLVEAVAGWARDAGADHLRLAVTDCDQSRPAAVLYRTLGFVDTRVREPLEWNPSLTTRILSRAICATA